MRYAVATPNTNEDGVVSCVVCMENVANLIFKPCCHQIVCTTCMEALRHDDATGLLLCPMCKIPVMESVVMPPLRTTAVHPSNGCVTWGTAAEEITAETAGRWWPPLSGGHT